MKQYKKKIDVSEAALEDLIRHHPELIDEGLVYLDHQKKAANGRLDLLLVNREHQLVVAELKVQPDDGMLIQGLDYYGDIASNVEVFARLYKHHEIDPEKPVVLFLIAPSFSQTLIERCKWINVPLLLFRFDCLKFEDDDEVVPVFSEQEIPKKPDAPVVSTISAHLAYITDEAVRAQVVTLLDDIKEWKLGNIALDPIKDAISIKANGRVFAYFWPRRKFYWLATYTSEDVWTEYPIKDDNQLKQVLPIIRSAMERKLK